MILDEHVLLKELTTLRVGGEARFVAYCENESDIKEAVARAKQEGVSFFVLGGGSNVLAHDTGYAGMIIRPLFDEVSFEAEQDGMVLVTAGANVAWDALVQAVAMRGLWGIENLAGIPGTVGAAPVQNIGAYGTELSDTLVFVDIFDIQSLVSRRLRSTECSLAYRDSRFKREPQVIILRVGLALRTVGTPNLSYKDIARVAKEETLLTPGQVGDAVRAIRSKKFPSLEEFGTAGSFFKNPIVSQEQYDELQKKFPELPGFPEGNGIKIPLAWFLDTVLNLRGFRRGHASLFERQPLVVVSEQGARASEVHELADDVAQRVFEATGITIEREVRHIPEK
jgi:UDP-N-acetylmuramate dehydrogenase